MSLSASDQQRWEQEQPVLEKARREHPELFVAQAKPAGELLRRVGILASGKDRPLGYIKYSPLDFIVEEIRPSDEVVTVDGETAEPEYPDGEGTVYADLVKVGISTLDAVGRIADALKIERKFIGYAGIKDAVALTAQRISLRGVSVADVEALSVPNCVLRNVVERKGAINNGNLNGNRFTLFIRTQGTLDEQMFRARVDRLRENGIMNYYGVQRFGSPRFLSHLFGLYLLRGDYKGCVEAVLTKPSDFDLPYYREKRVAATKHWGDWKKMCELFGELPYTYRYELQMLDVLAAKPDGWLAALEAAGEQGAMWARAYASYLVNLLLSEAEQTGATLPKEIPLLLGSDPAVDVLYGKWLEAHRATGYRKALRECRFLQVGKNPTIEPIIKPKVHGYKVAEGGVALSFDLTKGAYATTVLEWLFDVVTGYPVPAWLDTREMDTKQLLGTGDLSGVREVFAKAIGNVMGNKQKTPGDDGEPR